MHNYKMDAYIYKSRIQKKKNCRSPIFKIYNGSANLTATTTSEKKYFSMLKLTGQKLNSRKNFFSFL